MREALKKLREFHSKHGFAQDLKLLAATDQFSDESRRLIDLGTLLCYVAEGLQSEKEDPRMMRAHLLIEELGETIKAMACGNVVDTLDGLADLTYVVLGTAVAFGLPLAEAFDEVHASNMTKQRQTMDANGHRLRMKGPDYRPPDIKRILVEYGKLAGQIMDDGQVEVKHA